MLKKIGLVIVILLSSIYFYLYNQTVNPFFIDIASFIDPSTASKLINTKQQYEFRVQNTSKYPLKLINVSLIEYEGLTVNEGFFADGIRISSKNGLLVPSSTQNGDHSIREGVTIKTDATILKPNIINAQKVVFTYKFIGLTRKQIFVLPWSNRS